MPNLIALEDYHSRYANESGCEYWFGQVVKKTVPTWLHAILQTLLAEVFFENGYFSGSELDLRISRDFQPRPDVAASLSLESYGYPTKPVDIVAEVLSPDDSTRQLAEKCRHYQELGIAQLYVFDPVGRTAEQWNSTTRTLDRISVMTLTNGRVIPVESVFDRFDDRLKRRQ